MPRVIAIKPIPIRKQIITKTPEEEGQLSILSNGIKALKKYAAMNAIIVIIILPRIFNPFFSLKLSIGGFWVVSTKDSELPLNNT